MTYESWITNYGITNTSPSASTPPAYPGAYPYYSDAVKYSSSADANYASLTWGLILPYTSSSIVNSTINSNDFMNPQKFQIIGAGPDNMYSTPGTNNSLRYFPAAVIGYSQGDMDNASNFTTGALQDAAPQ